MERLLNHLFASAVVATAVSVIGSPLPASAAEGHFARESQTDRAGSDLPLASWLEVVADPQRRYESSWISNGAMPLQVRTDARRFRTDIATASCYEFLSNYMPLEPPLLEPIQGYFCREALREILATECAGHCALNRDCMAFTLVARPSEPANPLFADYATACWLKGSAPDPLHTPLMTSGVKYVDGAHFGDWYLNLEPHTDYPVYTRWGRPLPGKDIRSVKYVTEPECAGLCAQDKQCLGYSYITCSTKECLNDENNGTRTSGFPMLRDGRCWLKGTDEKGQRPFPVSNGQVSSAMKAQTSNLHWTDGRGHAAAMEQFSGVPINRAQIRIETGRVRRAETNDPVLIELLPYRGYGGTWLKRDRDDFARGDVYTYDLRLDKRFGNGERMLQEIRDIGQLRISKPGGDPWCLRSLVLRINGRPLFSKVFTVDDRGMPQECQWLGDGHASELVLSVGQLWDHTSWQNFGRYESLLVQSPPTVSSYEAHFSEVHERFAAVIHDIFVENDWRGPLLLTKTFAGMSLPMGGPVRGRSATISFPFRYKSGLYEKSGEVSFDYSCRDGEVSFSVVGDVFFSTDFPRGDTTTPFDLRVVSALRRGGHEIAFGKVDSRCPQVSYPIYGDWGPEGQQVSIRFRRSPAP